MSFSAVESPVEAFEKLPGYNWTKEDNVEIIMESQMVFKEVTNLSTIRQTSEVALKWNPNLIIAVTGNSCEHFNDTKSRRSRRAVTEKPEVKADNAVTVSSKGVLMYASAITLKVNILKNN